MSRRRLVVAGAGGLLVVIVVAAAFAFWPGGGTAVTADEAVERFRDEGGDATDDPTDGAAGDDAAPGRPPAGVYTFTATGQEDVKLGPLPTETRRYPGTVPVTIGHGDDGCFTVRVDLLAEHTEETTYCPTDDGGLRLADHRKQQTVGPMEPTATMTCREDVLVARMPAAGDDGDAAAPLDVACSLDLSGGPASVSAELTGTAVAEPATVEVGGDTVEAVAVHLAYELTGDLGGTWDEVVWLAADDLLPLRIERELDMSGLADFSETSELVLTDRVPAR